MYNKMNGGSDSSSISQQEKVLEEFRNAWKQEVKQKHVHDKDKSGGSSSSKGLVKEKEVDTTKEESIAELIEATESLTTTGESHVPVTAMDHYVIAVDNERQGKLGKGS